MGTDISVVGGFDSLTAGGDLAEALLANLGGGGLRRADLTWIKIPSGGITRWNWSQAGNDFSEKEIAGLLVVVTKIEYNLWPHATTKPGSMPFLRSLDGITGHRVGSDAGDLDVEEIEAARLPDGGFDWKAISYCQWHDRVPPRAKPSRVIGILRDGEASPLFLQISPTSLKPLDDFMRSLAAQATPHYRAVVAVSLEKMKGSSADYSRLVCRHVGTVDRERGDLAKRLYTDSITPILTGSIAPRAAMADTSAVPF